MFIVRIIDDDKQFLLFKNTYKNMVCFIKFYQCDCFYLLLYLSCDIPCAVGYILQFFIDLLM